MLTRTVTSLALTAAGPASALPRDLGPGDGASTIERIVEQPPIGTKSCTIEVTGPDGKKTTLTYPPGSKIKISGREYECQDGRWERSDPVTDLVGTAGDHVFEADVAWADWSGSLVQMELQAELSP